MSIFVDDEILRITSHHHAIERMFFVSRTTAILHDLFILEKGQVFWVVRSAIVIILDFFFFLCVVIKLVGILKYQRTAYFSIT